MERLLKAGAKVNIEPAWSPLAVAARRRHLAAVDRLLKEGANVNTGPGYFGRTELVAAAEGGHLEVVERLLANINADPRCSGGRIALEVATGGGHLEVVERLLKGGPMSTLDWRLTVAEQL